MYTYITIIFMLIAYPVTLDNWTDVRHSFETTALERKLLLEL